MFSDNYSLWRDFIQENFRSLFFFYLLKRVHEVKNLPEGVERKLFPFGLRIVVKSGINWDGFADSLAGLFEYGRHEVLVDNFAHGLRDMIDMEGVDCGCVDEVVVDVGMKVGRGDLVIPMRVVDREEVFSFIFDFDVFIRVDVNRGSGLSYYFSNVMGKITPMQLGVIRSAMSEWYRRLIGGVLGSMLASLREGIGRGYFFMDEWEQLELFLNYYGDCLVDLLDGVNNIVFLPYLTYKKDKQLLDSNQELPILFRYKELGSGNITDCGLFISGDGCGVRESVDLKRVKNKKRVFVYPFNKEELGVDVKEFYVMRMVKVVQRSVKLTDVGRVVIESWLKNFLGA